MYFSYFNKYNCWNMRNITSYTNQKVRLNLAKTSFVDHLLSCTDCSQNVHCIHLGFFKHLFTQCRTGMSQETYLYWSLLDICHLLYLCLYFLCLQVKTHTREELLVTLYYLSATIPLTGSFIFPFISLLSLNKIQSPQL